MFKVIHQETMCCGYKKCPAIKVFEDGSAEITDDDQAIGSVGTIKLTPEAFARIAELHSNLKK